MLVRVAVGAAVMLSGVSAHAASFEDASRATAFMAAASVCKSEVSPEKRRDMYADILRVYNTPSQVKYMIDQEVGTLRGMPPSERDAMCAALADQIKASNR